MLFTEKGAAAARVLVQPRSVTLIIQNSTEATFAPHATGLNSDQFAPSHPAAPLIDALLKAIDDAKAVDIISIDLAGKTAIADAMIVASGGSDRHVGAIAERVMGALRERGLPSPRVEGMPVCDWVLIDTGDVIVHLFRPEVRGFYNLEKLWGGGRPIEGAAAPVPAVKAPARPPAKARPSE